MDAGDRRVGLKTGRGGPCFLVSLSGSAVGFAFAWPGVDGRRRSRGWWRVSEAWPRTTSSGMAFERVEWRSFKSTREMGDWRFLALLYSLDTPRHL